MTDRQPRSNLTNKYNPQEHQFIVTEVSGRSNLTNKYNPQEPASKDKGR